MPRVFEKETLDSGMGQDNAECIFVQARQLCILTSNVLRVKVNDRVINE